MDNLTIEDSRRIKYETPGLIDLERQSAAGADCTGGSSASGSACTGNGAIAFACNSNGSTADV